MKRFFQVECGRCGSYSQTLTERDTLFRMEKPITVCGQCGQNDLLKVEEIKATTPCSHQVIGLVGNEETGLQSCYCQQCGISLTRRQMGDKYEYYPIHDFNMDNVLTAEVDHNADDSFQVRLHTAFGLVDLVFTNKAHFLLTVAGQHLETAKQFLADLPQDTRPNSR